MIQVYSEEMPSNRKWEMTYYTIKRKMNVTVVSEISFTWHSMYFFGAHICGLARPLDLSDLSKGGERAVKRSLRSRLEPTSSYPTQNFYIAVNFIDAIHFNTVREPSTICDIILWILARHVRVKKNTSQYVERESVQSRDKSIVSESHFFLIVSL